MLTLLLLLWRFLWRRSTPEKSQQPMLWQLSARQNLPGSSRLPIVAPFFDFFVLTRNEPGDRLDAVTRSPASRLICSRLAPSIEAATKKTS
ncbi:hypothetical protein QUA20_31465 [Microcoleus sp. Pol7_A1]|uniref:hypothetical protein n=1 Tax=Microcoleus sp. Pol7_A1 TaxID=2818893 RepID=UPI002FD3A4EB